MTAAKTQTGTTRKPSAAKVEADRKTAEAANVEATREAVKTPPAKVTAKVVKGRPQLVITSTVRTPAERRSARIAAAKAKVGPEATPASLAVVIGTAEVAKEAAVESLGTKVKAVEEAKTAADEAKAIAKAKEAALAEAYSPMVALAAMVNPDLVRPKMGPATGARKEAIDAVVATLGLSRPAAVTRVARWVGAGSLFLAQGTPMSEAYKAANDSLGTSSKEGADGFWTVVEAEAAATPAKVTNTRTPRPAGTGSKGTKATPPSVDVARTVVAEAEAKRSEAMTPAQRTKDEIRVILAAYARIVDGVKAGTHAAPSKADQTRVETAVKAIEAGKVA